MPRNISKSWKVLFSSSLFLSITHLISLIKGKNSISTIKTTMTTKKIVFQLQVFYIYPEI